MTAVCVANDRTVDSIAAILLSSFGEDKVFASSSDDCIVDPFAAACRVTRFGELTSVGSLADEFIFASPTALLLPRFGELTTVGIGIGGDNCTVVALVVGFGECIILAFGGNECMFDQFAAILLTAFGERTMVGFCGGDSTIASVGALLITRTPVIFCGDE
jgi:hypothetical protein